MTKVVTEPLFNIKPKALLKPLQIATNITISELENERDLTKVLKQGYPDMLTSKRHLKSGYRNQIPSREPRNTLSKTIKDFSHGDVSTRGKITLLNPNKSSAE
jgi:hypothetical protein